MTATDQINEKNLSKTGAPLSGNVSLLPEIYSLNTYGVVQRVLVVGCGGTGGHVIPNLARFISVLNSKPNRNRYQPNIDLYLADGDIVEEKNLIRQHFISPDVGKNKADVMAERYSSAFGIQIGVIPEYLEAIEDFHFLNRSGSYETSDLIIGCVDNNASRKVIHSFASKPRNQSRSTFWIDSGNEERSGQVVCGYSPAYQRYGRRMCNPYNTANKVSREGDFSLPFSVEVYPELLELEDEFSSKLSCAERAISAPQNMQTNVTAATIIMNFVQKIISQEPIKSHCVEFNINNAFNTKLNTRENLGKVNPNRRQHWEK